MAGPVASDVLGRVTLVTGPEEFLNERTVVRGARRPSARHDAEAEISRDHGRPADAWPTLGELAAPSLFSTIRCVVVRGLEDLPDESVDGLLDYAAAPAEDVALVLVHSGGQKGSGVLTKLRKLAGGHRGEVGGAASRRSSPASCPPRSRAPRRAGSTEDAADLPGAGRRAGPAVARRRRRPAGQRLPRRAADDRDGQAVLRRPGRGEVVRGRRRRASAGARAAALEELRWALDSGTAPVLVTSAFAGRAARPGPVQVRAARAARGRPGPRGRACRRGSSARCASRPAAGTTDGIARAIRAVARADADIKGAGQRRVVHPGADGAHHHRLRDGR